MILYDFLASPSLVVIPSCHSAGPRRSEHAQAVAKAEAQAEEIQQMILVRDERWNWKLGVFFARVVLRHVGCQWMSTLKLGWRKTASSGEWGGRQTMARRYVELANLMLEATIRLIYCVASKIARCVDLNVQVYNYTIIEYNHLGYCIEYHIDYCIILAYCLDYSAQCARKHQSPKWPSAQGPSYRKLRRPETRNDWSSRDREPPEISIIIWKVAARFNPSLICLLFCLGMGIGLLLLCIFHSFFYSVFICYLSVFFLSLVLSQLCFLLVLLCLLWFTVWWGSAWSPEEGTTGAATAPHFMSHNCKNRLPEKKHPFGKVGLRIWFIELHWKWPWK